MRDHLAEAAARIEHRDREASRVASARAVVLSSRGGCEAMVHRTTYPAPSPPWRTTFLDWEGEPAYHLESQRLDSAVKMLMGEGYEIVEVFW